MGHEPQRLVQRLGDNDAIERVAMQRRQSRDRCGMVGCHRQEFVSSGPEEPESVRPGDRHVAREPARERMLDGDLPDAGRDRR